jgi:hypothetical protein
MHRKLKLCAPLQAKAEEPGSSKRSRRGSKGWPPVVKAAVSSQRPDQNRPKLSTCMLLTGGKHNAESVGVKSSECSSRGTAMVKCHGASRLGWVRVRRRHAGSTHALIESTNSAAPSLNVVVERTMRPSWSCRRQQLLRASVQSSQTLSLPAQLALLEQRSKRVMPRHQQPRR